MLKNQFLSFGCLMLIAVFSLSLSLPVFADEESGESVSTSTYIFQNKDGERVTLDDEDFSLPESSSQITVNVPDSWFGQNVQVIFPDVAKNVDMRIDTVIDGKGQASFNCPTGYNASILLSGTTLSSVGSIYDTGYQLDDLIKYCVYSAAFAAFFVFLMDRNYIRSMKKSIADSSFIEDLDDV